MAQVDEWISAEFKRLAEVINDYDQYLFLEMVPLAEQQHLTDKSKVFRIVDDRNKKIVLYADSLSNPADILARLWSMDSKHGNVLNRLDAHNAAIEALKLKEQLDIREAQMDFTAFVIKNKKSRWEHNGKIYDDEFRNLGPKTTVID
jgi:hypothetical protein